MAGDDGSYGRLGDCCLGDGIQLHLYIDVYVRIRVCMTIYIWPCGPLRYCTIKLLYHHYLNRDDKRLTG